MTPPTPTTRRRVRRGAGIALVGVLVGSLVPFAAVPAMASHGGSAETHPVDLTLHPVEADGSVGGVLGSALDLPVLLGDHGSYVLDGLSTPEPDETGNGRVEREVPTGAVPGVITDPEDGDVDDEPGEGVDVGGGSESILRSPGGLLARTELTDVVIDIQKLNDKVGAVLGRDEIVRVDRLVTEALADVAGNTSVSTRLEGLALLGEAVPLTDGRLPTAATRAQTVHSDDVVALLRSLGVDEEDISEYAPLIDSSQMDGTFTVTAETPATGGLVISAHIELRIQADAGFLGDADVRADQVVMDGTVGGVDVTSPTPMAVSGLVLSADEVEAGELVELRGIGLIPGATLVTLGGTEVQVEEVTTDGTSLRFRIPAGLPSGDYTVRAETPGGEAEAGSLRVRGDDHVALTVSGVAPTRTHDGADVTVSGTGFTPGITSVLVTDSAGDAFPVAASDVTVTDSRLQLKFRLPEGLALGTATLLVSAGGESDSTEIEIAPLELPPVPSSGAASVTGSTVTTSTVPLTEDNSSVVTWDEPDLINPAGTAGTTTQLEVGLPDIDTNGNGTRSATVAGITGTVTRQISTLTAVAEADGWSMSLPAPWHGFFARGSVITADRIRVESTATASGGVGNDIALSNLRVLGNPVTLVDGMVQNAQEFTVSIPESTLESRQAMNGVFFSRANEAYEELQSASAQLWIRVEPASSRAADGTADAAAFRVVADLKYHYEGENGGFFSTRARHGTGGNRSGERVNMLNAEIARTTVTAPAAVAPDVLSATPRLVDTGDTVTLAGRGFSADSVVRYGDRDVTPASVASDGTSLTFVVPADAVGSATIAVRTSAGTSATTRTVTVMSAPEVTDHPESVSVEENGTVQLASRATGTPAPSIRWEREVDGVWTTIEGEQTESLTIDVTRDDNGARFRAVFSNAKGDVASNPATLSVEYAPEFVELPEQSAYTAGDTARFTAVATGNPTPAYRWEIDRGAGWVSFGTGTTVEHVLTEADHDALLRVVAGNSQGEVESEPLQLTVEFGARITVQPADAEFTEGTTASFTAAATGNPIPSVHWQFRHALGGEWMNIDAESYPSATTGTLELPAQLVFDGLLFRAVFDNGVGTAATTDSAKLTVRPVPVDPGEPGDSDFAALSGPLAIGVEALVGTGEAVGALAGLINAELAEGAEVGESGTFALPESAAPSAEGELVREYDGGPADGENNGDIAAGTSYGDVLVRNVWDSDGMSGTVTVESFVMSTRSLDEKGRVGTLLGIDELVRAEGVTATALAPGDADFDTSASAKVDRLWVFGEELGEADGFVDGRLAAPVIRTHEVTITDLASMLGELGLDTTDYLSEEILGEASATARVTVDQPLETEADTASAIGLRVRIQAGFDLEVETQGVDRSILESLVLTTEGLRDVVDIEIAATAVARNGAGLPEPQDPTDPGSPGEEPETPPLDVPDLPLRDIDAYVPTAEPSRVIQTVTGDAATSRTVTWRTDDSVESAVLEFRPVGGAAVAVPAETRDALDRRGEQQDEVREYRAATHVATMSGLEPSTGYEYRVGDGGENWSDWFAFDTAAVGDAPVDILYMGDAQNDLRAQWEEALQMAWETVPDVDVAIHAGDQVNHPTNDVQWGEWFGSSPRFFGEVLQVATPGNHEFTDGALTDAWREHFTFPHNGPVVDPTADECTRVYQGAIVESLRGAAYYVDYQGVRMISLSGTIGTRDFLPSPGDLVGIDCSGGVDVVQAWMDVQADFLTRALEGNPGDWSILTMHQPIFSTSTGRDNSHLRDALLPIIEEHDVDLILQGHDHTYGRGYLESNIVEGAADLHAGPVYVVSVLGPKSYDLDTAESNDWTENGARRVTAYENVRTFQEISIDGGRLSYTAHRYNSGEIVDAFEICKNDAGEKLVAETSADLPADCDAAQNPGGGEGENPDGGEGENPDDGGPAEIPAPISDAELDRIGEGGIDIEHQDGRRLLVDVGVERAGEWVGAYVHSTPMFVGWFRVDDAGRITVDIPTSVPAGDHRLVVVDSEGALIGWSGFALSGSTALADTGAVLGLPVLLALLGLVVGAGLLSVRRRRMIG